MKDFVKDCQLNFVRFNNMIISMNLHSKSNHCYKCLTRQVNYTNHSRAINGYITIRLVCIVLIQRNDIPIA